MKRLLAVGLGVLLLALAGCGGAEADSEHPTIGLLAPLTGASASTAQEQRNVAQLAVDQFNAAGGINGKPVQLRVYDTQLLPNVAIQQAQRAITQDKVAALLGPFSTSEALAVKILVDRAKVPTITGSASTESITQNSQYLFRTAPLSGDLAAGLIQTALTLGVRKPVLLHDSGASGLAFKALLEKAAKANGLTLTQSIQYPLSGSDFSAEVAKAAAGPPDGVLLAGSAGADYGLVAKTMAEQGLSVPLLGFSPIVLPDAIAIAGSAYTTLPGVYTVQGADRTKPEYKALLAAYNQRFDRLDNLPEQVSGIYDAANFALDAMRRTGGQGGEPLAAALESLPARVGANGLTGAEEQFAPGKHDAFSGIYVVPYKMQNGVPVQDTSISLG